MLLCWQVYGSQWMFQEEENAHLAAASNELPFYQERSSPDNLLREYVCPEGLSAEAC